jgi:1-acyl-sn-glycerol-3-phosphate acyltransferase
VQIFSYILTPLFFLLFGIILLVFHPLLLIGRFLFGFKGIDAVMSVMIFLLMKMLYLVLGMKYVYYNFEKIPTNVPVMFISNHQSMWDIPPVMYKFRRNRPKFIAKKELTGIIPSVSFYLKYGGPITIDRSKPNDAIDSIRAFTKDIESKGYSISIYPEGTRSKDGKVGPFKTKGVRVVLEEIPEILIVPLAMHNTRQIDNDGKFFKKLGTKIKVSMLAPRQISIESFEEEMKNLRKEIEDTISSE